MMQQRHLVLAAAGGSLALLAGAFFFQWLGYAPCQMCIWQRWPHAAAVVIGGFAVLLSGRFLPLLGALAAATAGGLGFFHTGVERGWWQGPTTCSGGGNLLEGDIFSTEGPALVLCDMVTWQFLGLSMASWNAIFSLGFVAIWLLAARRA